MNALSHLEIRNPKDDETPIEAASQIFASVLSHPYVPTWKKPIIKPQKYAFEIYLAGQLVHFYITSPTSNEAFTQSLVTSSFPQSVTKKTTDPLASVLKSPEVAVGEVVLNSYYHLPIKTYLDFKDIDPLSSLLGFLSKQPENIKMAVQILVTPASFPWQDHVVKSASKMTLDSASGNYAQNPQRQLILKKAAFQGGKVAVRLVVGAPQGHAMAHLRNLAGSFGSFSLGEGNQFVFKRPYVLKERFQRFIRERRFAPFEKKYQILNAAELATLWHPPGYLLAGIKNIAWGKTLSGEPPENLPVPDIATGGRAEEHLTKAGTPSLSEEERGQAPLRREDASSRPRKLTEVEGLNQDANFFARTEFKNKDQIFGLKTPDRRKHVYIIGKTGAGKSTLIANMAIDDIRKDRGVAIIDPHGDLSQIILDYIPKRRLNDVVYLEPFDTTRPFSLNILEVSAGQHKDLVASGIVSIFYKLYGDSWGPRLEYILRNVILTLLEIEGATLVDVLRLLSDEGYRREVVRELKDPVLKSFWEKEFEKMPASMRAEAVSPIQNKVGQFVSSKMIRNIIGHPTSTLDLVDIMNQGKILILNLSQGKLGEDNAALLGAMIITQIQLAAMGRSYQKEDERRDFFLYVDEFQNFATQSFIKILSEARKYRLSLTLANQYIDQLDEEVQRAVFGNVGTLISFVMGAHDAYIFSKEFGELYTEQDLVSLGKYETVLKLSIDGHTSAPFPATTLPLPSVKNDNREKIVKTSKERYGRKIS